MLASGGFFFFGLDSSLFCVFDSDSRLVARSVTSKSAQSKVKVKGNSRDERGCDNT